MDLGNRVTQIEDEIKVLKNEMMAVLLDVKESLLDRENPFVPQAKSDGPTITINQAPASPASSVDASQNAPITATTPKKIHLAPLKEEDMNQDSLELEPDGDYGGVRHYDAQKTQLQHDLQKTGGAKGNGNGHDQQLLNSKTDKVRFENSSGAVSFGCGGEMRRDAEVSNPRGTNQTATQNPICRSNIELSTLANLSDWVVATSGDIGPQNTQMILDISGTVGHMPADLKTALEKMIPREVSANPEEAINTKAYLKALNSLAALLGRTDATSFIMLQMVSRGLNPMTKSGGNWNG